jgi:hypothetical protein
MVAFTGTMGYPACPDETTDGLGGAATQNNGTIPESSHKSPEENPSKEHPQQKYKKVAQLSGVARLFIPPLSQLPVA